MVCNTVTYSDLQKKLQCSCMLCNCSRRLRTCCSTRVWSWTSSECSTAVFLLSVCVLCQYLLYLLWLVNTQKCMKSQVITNELFLMISIKRWYMTTEAHVYSCKMSFLSSVAEATVDDVQTVVTCFYLYLLAVLQENGYSWWNFSVGWQWDWDHETRIKDSCSKYQYRYWVQQLC